MKRAKKPRRSRLADLELENTILRHELMYLKAANNKPSGYIILEDGFFACDEEILTSKVRAEARVQQKKRYNREWEENEDTIYRIIPMFLSRASVELMERDRGMRPSEDHPYVEDDPDYWNNFREDVGGSVVP